MGIRIGQLVILLLILTACQQVAPQAEQATIQPSQRNANPPSSSQPFRATPISDSPAAGICAEFETSIVTVEIQDGMPSPRCAIVFTDQRIKLLNGTLIPIEVIISNYRVSLAPAEEQFIDHKLGEILELGVHFLMVIPEGGGAAPELWVKQR